MQNRFSDQPIFAAGSILLQTVRIFVLSTLEKNHQMLLRGPWSSTYDVGWIKNKKSSPCFWKMFWKSFLYMSTSSLFLIPQIHMHTEFEKKLFLTVLKTTCVGDSRETVSWSLWRKSRLFYTQNIFKKNYSFIASRMEKYIICCENHIFIFVLFTTHLWIIIRQFTIKVPVKTAKQSANDSRDKSVMKLI